MSTLLEVRNLCIHFQTEQGEIQAVRDVSFSLASGETLAIVGESGCGKTVLCKSIPRILPHSGRIVRGEILLDGKALTTLSERELCAIRGQEVAMVFQDPFSALDPTSPVGEQIAEAMRVHTRVSRRTAAARAIALLEQVGVDRPEQRAKQYPHAFSGGMCQRAALAVALACRPKLLIADEPTTALDADTQEQILTLIDRLRQESGIAVLFITHDLQVAARAAQRIAVMYAGKIVEIGKADEILSDPRHPYTKGLLASLPAHAVPKQPLRGIPGMPPDLLCPPLGDAFAARNPDALYIDFAQEPPFFKVSETHFAATWLLDPRAPQGGGYDG